MDVELAILHTGENQVTVQNGIEYNVQPFSCGYEGNFAVGFQVTELSQFVLVDSDHDPFAAYRTIQALNNAEYIDHTSLNELANGFLLRDEKARKTILKYISPDAYDSIISLELPVEETANWFLNQGLPFNARNLWRELAFRYDSKIEKLLKAHEQRNLVIDGLRDDYGIAKVNLNRYDGSKKSELDLVGDIEFATYYNEAVSSVLPTILTIANEFIAKTHGEDLDLYEKARVHTKPETLQFYTDLLETRASKLSVFNKPLIFGSPIQREIGLFFLAEQVIRGIVSAEQVLQETRSNFILPESSEDSLENILEQSRDFIAQVNGCVKEHMTEMYGYDESN